MAGTALPRTGGLGGVAWPPRAARRPREVVPFPRLYQSCWDPAPVAILGQPMPSGLRPRQQRVRCYCCHL